ncbi:MAG TPA: YihY/virulence factor BrkB family protein [Longimicrobiales bacterium]
MSRTPAPTARPDAPPPHRLARPGAAVRRFLRDVYEKADADNISFMAGAIAFNVLVAFIPLLLAAVGIAGVLLRLRHADPTEPLLRYLDEAIPPVSDQFRLRISETLREVIGKSTGLLGIGTLILVWIATRLVGTLRTTLREVFDMHETRGFIAGKLFDIQMVVAAGTLLALNVALTVMVDFVARFGFRFLGIAPGEFETISILYGRLIALLVVWVMFLLIYRFLPPRALHWRTALVAATFTAVLFELLKAGFSWYVTNVANYGSTYGSLATVVILVLWIYYTAVVFVLGGEVAQVVAMRRIRRQQKERLR